MKSAFVKHQYAKMINDEVPIFFGNEERADCFLISLKGFKALT